MDGQSASASKQTWLIIFAALVASVLIYGLLCYFVEQNSTSRRSLSPPTTLRPFLYALAGVALLASVAWMNFRTSGRIGGAGATLMSPGQFQTETIVGMALAECCVIFGLLLFFLGAPLSEFWRFAAGTLLVDLLFILPKGLNYWTAWDAQQKAQQNASTGPFSQ